MADFTTIINNIQPENVLIVDLLNYCFRFKHKKQRNFAKDCERDIRSIAKSYTCGTIIVTADWSGSSFRKEVFPEYKANRKDLIEKQSPEEKEDSRLFFDDYEEAIKHLSYLKDMKLFRYKGVEADDLASMICSRRLDLGYNKIWLLSSDRDWDLLIDQHISRFSHITRQEITIDTWPYEVTMEQYLSYKILLGDASDGIPGIPGVGPKRAKALLDQYGSAWDIYDSCPLPGKQKFIQAVNENKERIPLNYELMDLKSFCADAIGLENVNDMFRELVFK